VLGALEQRLGNDPATERDVVREELRKIVDLRLGKAFS
jgi:2-oxo-4-hydroxy-4-carboxy-5-ureidoimidazoline decarboxylase